MWRSFNQGYVMKTTPHNLHISPSTVQVNHLENKSVTQLHIQWQHGCPPKLAGAAVNIPIVTLEELEWNKPQVEESVNSVGTRSGGSIMQGTWSGLKERWMEASLGRKPFAKIVQTSMGLTFLPSSKILTTNLQQEIDWYCVHWRIFMLQRLSQSPDLKRNENLWQKWNIDTLDQMSLNFSYFAMKNWHKTQFMCKKWWRHTSKDLQLKLQQNVDLQCLNSEWLNTENLRQC